MLFNYTSIDEKGEEHSGSIDALNEEVAISALQRRGLVVSRIEEAGGGSMFSKRIKLFERVSNKEIVILSRQVATLFSAQVSALKIFQMIAKETENPKLRDALTEIASDIQGGSSLAKALEKQSDIFSPFYVNMVRAGEESGNLENTFMALADYLDRTYELTSKAKNALIYPAFVVFTFITVMALMLTLVIPKISQILVESGQEIPTYTKIVIGLSNFLRGYGFFFVLALVVAGIALYKYSRTDNGERVLSEFKLGAPFFGGLYRKLYLSRLADNMNTMLSSGIPLVRSLEITASVVDNRVFEDLLKEAVESVKGGKPVSEALSQYEEIPGIMIQMMRVGEESGELGSILKTLAKFYQREVNNAVDTLVDLIEPAMIVLLGLGVAVLLASVLIPIYNVSSGF